MRHFVALPLAATLALGSAGCSQLPTVSPDVGAFAKQVQAAAVRACDYEPSLASLTQIIISAVARGASGQAAAAGLTLGDFIAKGVCGVVTAKSGVGRKKTLYGVPIRGHFR